MGFDYRVFSYRNAPLLSDQDQEKLRRTRLLVAGCGSGSLLAESAVRMGFEHLVLVDGDTIELSNTNRQAYEFADIGRYKVEALSERLNRINPQCDVTAIPQFLTPANAEAILELADIAVDFIDILAIPDVVTLHEEARRQRKSVVSPLGIGWGAVIFVFTSDSATLEETFQMYAGADIRGTGNADLASLLRNLKDRLHGIPPYVLGCLESSVQARSFQEAVAVAAQPAIMALCASNLATMAVVKLALGLPVIAAPQAVYFDPWLAFESPNGRREELFPSAIEASIDQQRWSAS